MTTRIIGDIHGKVAPYIKLISDRNIDFSVAVGDIGFKETYCQLEHDHKKFFEAPYNHVFVPGNHDDYDNLPDWALVDYGIHKQGNLKFFFIRGAESIDKYNRIEGKSWWGNEQLNFIETTDCINAYEEAKPDVVISHDCPLIAYNVVLTNANKARGSNTSRFLSECFKLHPPRHWFFGHHHNTMNFQITRTTFHCLGELAFFDVEV